MKTFAALFSPWVWRMAWRDARAARLRLVLYGLNLALGLAALTAVESFRRGAERSVDVQARAMIGADAVVTANRPFNPEQQAAADTLVGERARDVSLASMLSAKGGTRLVNVHAVTTNFPLYGRLETEPASAAAALSAGGGVVLDAAAMRQLELRPGDAVRLGRSEFRVLGALRKAPGETLGMNTLAPRLYVALGDLAATGLAEGATLARHRLMIRFADAEAGQTAVRERREEFRRLGMSVETVARRTRDLGGALDRFSDFLELISVAALALGGAGVAGAMKAHLAPRLLRVATLRCLGCPGPTAQAVYVVQAGVMAVAGAAAGIAVGSLMAAGMAAVASLYLPAPIAAPLSVVAAGRAAALGLAATLWFCLPALAEAGAAPPLAALRAAYEPPRRSRLAAGLSAAGGVALIFAAAPHTGGWELWLGWSGGLVATLVGLAAAGTGAAALMRVIAPRLPFAWRHGLANLHRPNRRTGVLVASLGLGAMVLVTLQNCRETLVSSVLPPRGALRSDALLFDIQPDQIDGLRTRLGELGFPVLEAAPMVTMRLAGYHGSRPQHAGPPEGRRRDGERGGERGGGPEGARAGAPGARGGRDERGGGNDRGGRGEGRRGNEWALRREYRCTWRDRLTDAERVTAGAFVGTFSGEPSETNRVPVAVEEGLAEGLGLAVGDTLDFDVQGVPVPCRVGCLREVEWRQVRPNFFVVFPAGVLEQAPATWLVAATTGGAEGAARLEKEVFKAYPNVSVVDLTLALETLDSILGKVASAAGVLAGFCSVAGVLTLISAAAATQPARRREAAIWRALGASRGQLEWMAVAEHVGAGLCAAIAALALAEPATWAIAHGVFKAPVQFAPGAAAAVMAALPALTAAAGWWSGRSAAATSPLAVLREIE